ncbi:hypothetical protein JST56_00560 [Candidatus Dependentiae bacterium]|jgi:ankyrin repeat protein|nr:hypothetical protein [Candidatus Dependentiae bacterium]
MNMKRFSAFFAFVLLTSSSVFAMYHGRHGGRGRHHGAHHGMPSQAAPAPITPADLGLLLQRACASDDIATVQALVTHADIADFINHLHKGKTALDIALDDINIPIRNLLQANGGLQASALPAPAPQPAPAPVPGWHGGYHGHGKHQKQLDILNADPATTLEPGRFLRVACSIGDKAKVEAILQRADVASFIDEVGRRGQTALGIATETGNGDIKQLLTDAGAVAVSKPAAPFSHHHSGRHGGGHGHGHGHGRHGRWHNQ